MSAETWPDVAEPGSVPAEVIEDRRRGERIDGAEVLDDLRSAVTTFCVLPTEEHTDAVVLWIAATHCLPAFDYASRLVVRSAEKRSGKSRLLEVIDATCHSPLRAVNATVAAIFRSLGGAHPPTLLLDEADTIFGSKKVAENNEDLRGLLNAGYQRGLPVLRTVGPTHEPVNFETFAMAALAGIGHMPDTIEDRAVVVPMRRRKPSEAVRPYRIRRDKPTLEAVAHRVAEWAGTVLEALADADPELPVEDRAADTWAPLVAVADAAGGTWPKRARGAAVRLSAEAEEADEEGSLNLRLLADIERIFEETGSPFLRSAVLCEHLHRVEDAPWRDFELNPSKLGRRLREYGIRSAHNTTRSERGYRLEHFIDAFERYTRPKASGGVQTAESRGKVTDTLEPDGRLQGVRSAEGVRPQTAESRGKDANGHLRTPPPPESGTCSACGGRMTVTEPGQTTHPGCEVH